MIVAMDSRNGIGKNNTIPWNIKEDIERFKKITTGTCQNNMVVMGRKTWETIPPHHRPLKDRINVILSRNEKEVTSQDVIWCSDKQQIYGLAQQMNVDNLFVIGGSEIYQLFIEEIHVVYVTRVYGVYDCDTFFPVYKTPSLIADIKIRDTHRFETWHFDPSPEFSHKNHITKSNSKLPWSR